MRADTACMADSRCSTACCVRAALFVELRHVDAHCRSGFGRFGLGFLRGAELRSCQVGQTGPRQGR